MRILLSFALTTVWCGCSTPESIDVDLDAATAKRALLDLMRSESSPFEGADPVEMEKIALEQKSEGVFEWGAFRIDVNKKTYAATVAGDDFFWDYSGEFIVDRAGRWTAVSQYTAHASGRPPNEPDNDGR